MPDSEEPLLVDASVAHGPRTAAGGARAASDEVPRAAASRRGHVEFLRSVFATLLAVSVISGAAWFLYDPGSQPASGAVTLTATAPGPAPKIGNSAPGFRLFDLDGESVELENFLGRPVWITFWATWCPPCRAETPDIEATYERFRDSGLVVVAIDVGEDPGTVASYVERTGTTFAVALDTSTAVAARYRIAGVPSHFLVDASGVLRDVTLGPMSKKEMERRLQAILPVPPD
jgi:peroxiredoxin